MTAEDFYKELKYTEYDKFDKKASKFTYYDLLEFAEQYHAKQLKLSVVSQQRELLLAYEKYTSYKVLGKETNRVSKQMVEDFLANNCG